jgi:hypothetical protein
MKRPGRRNRAALATLTLAILSLSLSLPAWAQEEGQGTDTTVPAGDGTTLVTTHIEPAVPVQPPVESPTTPDWTYRYMIPTALLIAVVVVLMTSIRYFTNVVRKRYRIVE